MSGPRCTSCDYDIDECVCSDAGTSRCTSCDYDIDECVCEEEKMSAADDDHSDYGLPSRDLSDWGPAGERLQRVTRLRQERDEARRERDEALAKLAEVDELIDRGHETPRLEDVARAAIARHRARQKG